MSRDVYGNLSVSQESWKPTYAIGVELLAANIAANATDIFQITGSATKIIKINRVEISADATAVGAVDFYIIKRTTANTGGTAAPVTAISYDSTDIPYTATVQTYSVNPTLGAGVIIRAEGYALPAAGTTGYPFSPIVYDFGVRNTKCPTLRGIAESLVFNWGGQAVNAGLDIWLNIEWTEEVISVTP